MASLWNLQETKEGLQFKIKVQPRASKNEIAGLQEDALKIRLTAPPVEGEANAACIRFIAQKLGIATSRVTIVSGHTGRNKIVLVEGVNKEQLLQQLGL